MRFLGDVYVPATRTLCADDSDTSWALRVKGLEFMVFADARVHE